MKSNLILVFFLAISQVCLGQILKDKWVECNSQGCTVLDPYFSEGVTMTWDGPCVDGKANGFGKLMKYVDGQYESTYVGDYKKGIREGKGKFSHKDGTVREGNFINGQLMGQGIMNSEDGQRYVGNYINYRMHGKVTTYFANGAKFEGFFVNDRMYTGKLTDHDGKIKYIQQFYQTQKINEKTSGYKPQIGVRLTEYFDADWNRCKQSEASYYRLITYELENKPKGLVKDYYISGELQSEFFCVYIDYDDEGKNFHEGQATWYHKNGKIEQIRYYYNNKVNGKNTHYFDNGQIASELMYNHGVLNGEFKRWYKTGKLAVFAVYDNGELVDNKYVEYDENGFGALVYNENFYRNKSNWEVKTNGSESVVTDESFLKIVLTKDASTARWNYITLDQSSDYSIESIIHKTTCKG
ncbi:MAG: hypothetical protein IT270_13625, partial [Saprospiraceae bacterium]|nr:hypothetical protein [Saprospiraceae bacterium]